MFVIVAENEHGESMLIKKAFGGKSLYASAEDAKRAIDEWIALAYAPCYPEWRFSWDEAVEDPGLLDEGYRMFCFVESEMMEPQPFAAVVELK